MENENFLNNQFYKAIKKACEYNYICLYVQNQINGTKNNQIYSAKDIFGQTKDDQQIYLDTKLEIYSTQRNKFFSTINPLVFNKEIEAEFETQKNNLTDEFNAYYGKNKTFDEIVCNNVVMDERFASDLCNKPGEEFAPLSFALSAYLQALSDYNNASIARDLLSTLDNDLYSNGYKSFYYGSPTSNNVYKMDQETLNALIAYGNNTSEKKLKDLKKLEKKNPAGSDLQELDAYKEIASDAVTLEVLQIYLNALRERYRASTKPPFSKKLLLQAKFNDATIGGLNPFKKYEPDDFFYVHKSELVDICSLLSVLKDTGNLIRFTCKKTGFTFDFEEEKQEEQQIEK